MYLMLSLWHWWLLLVRRNAQQFAVAGEETENCKYIPIAPKSGRGNVALSFTVLVLLFSTFPTGVLSAVSNRMLRLCAT